MAIIEEGYFQFWVVYPELNKLSIVEVRLLVLFF